MSEELQELVENRYEDLIQSLPGRILPKRYRIDKLLSENPYMAIYNTFYEPEEKVVNLRVFRVLIKSEEDYQFRRFKQEVKRLMGLKHPNIVPIIDCGLLDEGLPYIVYENVTGPTLEEILVSHNRLEVDQVGLVFTQITKAVQVAHEYGVLHETLKPSRIIVSETAGGDAIVIVTGFGLVALHNKLGLAVKTPYTRQKMIGTAAYMAPEQCTDGVDVDGRADIYAIGCMMYECLCGQVPFMGSEQTVMRMHLENLPTPIPEVRKDLEFPKLMLGIVNKCMVKDLTKRYQYVKDLQFDVERGVDPTEREQRSVIPEAIQKAEKRVKETKEGPYKLIGMVVGGLAAFVGVLYVGSYVVTTTGQVANNAVWRTKLDAAIKNAVEGKTEEAREGFLDALAEAHKFPKPDVRLATTDNEIADFYNLTGRYPDSISLLAEAISTEDALKTPDAAVASRSFELLSAAQLAKGKTNEAFDSANKAVVQAEKMTGEKTERLFRSSLQLFKACIAANKLPEAKAAIEKMKEAISKTNSILSMEIVSGEKQSEALFDQASKKYDQAEKELQDVLGSRQDKIGLASLPSIETMNYLGKLYADEGKYTKAIKMLESAYDAKQKILGESSPVMVELAFQIAQIYEKSKNTAQTEKYLRLAYDMAEKSWGKGNAETLPYIDALGKFLRDQKKVSAAEVYEVEALDIRHPERVSKLGRR